MSKGEEQEVWVASMLHPDGRLELLYAFDNEKSAVACGEAYGVSRRYTGEDGYRFKLLAMQVWSDFDPQKHTEGLVLEAGVQGDFR